MSEEIEDKTGNAFQTANRKLQTAMEPELIAFLKKVSKSILIAVVWLGITSIAAIKGDNAFIEGGVRIGNVLFYCWLAVSIFFLVRIYKKVWKSNENEV